MLNAGLLFGKLDTGPCKMCEKPLTEYFLLVLKIQLAILAFFAFFVSFP